MGARRLVLVVEDDEAIRTLLRMLLEDAAAYAIALRQARATPPDVIVLDMVLPGLDGYEVARRLRADKATRGCWIIGISANQDAPSALAAGCDRFLPKPIDIAELEEQVRAGLARRSSRPAVHSAAPANR